MLYGAEAIGRHLGVTAEQVAELIAEGGLPARKAGGAWWISREAVELWLGATDRAWTHQGGASHKARPISLSDSRIAAFLAARTTPRLGDRVAARTMFLAYRVHAERQGWTPLTEKAFALATARQLGRSQRTTIDGRNCNAYGDVDLRPSEPPTDG